MPKTQKGNVGTLCLLLLMIVMAYSNTFNAAWHFDDITNILDNRNVQVSTLSLDEWSRSIRSPFFYPGQTKPPLYRPIAMLTLAMNWYLGEENVLGYHIVNIAIHCATAVLLFYTSLILLRAPNMKSSYQGSEYFIALMSTALWALHPIQIPAVTYIVQRMASLAAFFYLFGIFAYVKGRSARTKCRRGVFYGLCAITFVLALGSKKNTVTLPAALLLIELIFYADYQYLRHARGKWTALTAVVGLIAFFFVGLFLWSNDPISKIMRAYQIRPFTLFERVLTEFRVLVLYLKQIVYPIPQQFSFIHDIKLSTSLTTPWTTMASIALVAGLIIAAVAAVRKNRLFSFAILFYFLGHSVESTVFPLELVFEHRNYLPTLFLFLPIAAGVKALMDRYRQKNALVYGLLRGFLPIILLGFGTATYIRNMAWATEKTIWQDAIQKAPALARPYQGLALALEREYQLELAFKLYEKALDLEDPSPKLSRFISYSNMGNICKKRKAYDKAVYYLTAALSHETGAYVNRVRYNLVLCLLNNHKEDEALKHIDVLLGRNNSDGQYLTTKGFILFQQGKISQARDHLRAALKQNPGDNIALMNLAMVLSAFGDYERADLYLHQARKRDSKNIVIYLGLLQNAAKMQDEDRIERYLFQTTNLFSIIQIQNFFGEHAKGYHYINGTLVSIEDRVVLPYLAAYLKEKALTL